MKGQSFITIAAVMVAVASIAYATGRSVQASPNTSTPVQVTNTSSQCVPVTVYHSVALPVTEAGSWVMRPVNAATTPIFVKDVDNEVRSAFSHTFSIDVAANYTDAVQTYQVPAGKTLLVKSVSGYSAGQSSTYRPTTIYVSDLHGTTAVTYWGTNVVGADDNAIFAIIPNPTIYLPVPAGDYLQVTASRDGSGAAGEGFAAVTVTGELVNTP